MVRSTLALVAVLSVASTMVVAGSAVAGPLAPAKASELVNLFAFPLTSGICCSSGIFAFDHQLDSNGARSAFTLPAKETLVVTEVDWLSLAGTSGQDAIAEVVIEGSSGCDTLGATSVGVNDSAGNAGGTLIFPTGIVLRSGTQICVTIGGSGSLNRANVHGFLAKDQ